MPKAPPVSQLLSQAGRLYTAGDPVRAGMLCREALRQSPDHVPSLHLMSVCRMAMGDIAGAEESLARAVRLAPREPDLIVGHGAMLLRLGRLDEAIAAADRALSLRPGDPNAASCKAEALFRLRRFDEAAAAIEPFIGEGKPIHLPIAMALATLAQRIHREDEAIAMLEKCRVAPGLPAAERLRVLISLTELLDAKGRYDDAFAACQEANTLKQRRPDIDAYHASLDAMLSAWSKDVVSGLPRASLETELPVYIVGMPRSGTSLVEQILASHPGVHGGGERRDIGRAIADIEGGRTRAPYHLQHPEALTRKVVDRTARKVADTLRAVAPQADRVTDKNPDNYLHLGLISLLFPKARIIHCVRDAMDICLSCYLTSIGRRGPGGFSEHAFADSLEDLGRWHRNYERVMAHWKSVLSLNMLEVRYEDLVQDFESTARRLVEFTGLPWDDACLRYHESRRVVGTPSMDQVRRPIYASSVGRWKNYESHLAPLKAALAGQGS